MISKSFIQNDAGTFTECINEESVNIYVADLFCRGIGWWWRSSVTQTEAGRTSSGRNGAGRWGGKVPVSVTTQTFCRNQPNLKKLKLGGVAWDASLRLYKASCCLMEFLNFIIEELSFWTIISESWMIWYLIFFFPLSLFDQLFHTVAKSSCFTCFLRFA